MSAPLRILLLADDQKGANTIHHHIQSFKRYSKHDIQLFNPRNLSSSRFLNLDAFDVVVIHYSIAVIWDHYFSPWFREQMAAYEGLKVQFIQDEYREVNLVTTRMREMGINVLYSVVPEETVGAVYGARLPDTEVLSTLTGYVPEEIVGVGVPRLSDRPVDVGYRGRSVPFWLGRLGYEKVEIGRTFLARAEGSGLRCDIAWAELSRIYGDRWYTWIASCRAMLGSESGSSIVDFDGSIETAVRRYIAEHPHDTFVEVERTVLAKYENGPAINAISPRVFEAAAMRTALVMFPGAYSGVVREWEHYVPLEKDFSNVEEVIGKINDPTFLQDLTERNYDDLIASQAYSYQRFVAGFDAEVDARATRNPNRRGRLATHLLRAEELRAGRTYGLSSIYSAVRELALTYLATGPMLRHRALRRLAATAMTSRRNDLPNAPTLWDDVRRFALLVRAQAGALRQPEQTFHLDVSVDGGRLTFTSRADGEPATSSDGRPITAAIRARTVQEILWNHAPVGQYVALPLPLIRRSIFLDIGRYDAYGIYRFSRLAEVALADPELVLAALEPLLSPATQLPLSNDSEANP